MSNLSSFTSSDGFLVTVLGLLVGVGWWVWHWSRRGEGRRWAWDAFVLLLLFLQWTRQLTAPPKSTWGWLGLVLLSAGLCVTAGFCARDVWRWWRSRAPAPATSLRGQLVLVVLPVLGLAVAGMVSLAHDRAAVEEAARQQAVEISRNLAAKLSETLLVELVRLEQAGADWNVSSHGPDPLRPSGYPPSRLVPLPAEWQRRYPLPPAEVLPVELRFDTNGALRLPPGYPPVPRPNPRTTRLTDTAADAWNAVMQLAEQGADSATLDPAARAFERLSSDPEFLHQLAFLRLLRETNRFERGDGLLTLAESAAAQRIKTESGIPLGIAVLAEALRDPPITSLDDAWARPIAELTLTQPSSLTPWLLDRAEELGRRASDLDRLQWVEELRARWRSAERRRGLAVAVQERLPLAAGLVTNLWLSHLGAAWWVVVQPVTNRTVTLAAGTRVTNEVAEVGCRIFREDLLGFAVHHAAEAVNARRRDGLLPSPPRVLAGLKLSVECAGREVPLPRSDWAVMGNEQLHRVLAEASAEFPTEAVTVGYFERFDAWPSRPRFTVRVHLADAAALFAAQRRQQWLFGGMILVTAGVAGLGAWQMNRAFRRQLALNEEKSNFVASVSHELRTPLASLRLLAEGLASGRVQEEAKRREYASFLVQEARRLGALVENVLDFARIEQGRKRYQFEPTDLARLVAATVNLMEPLARERKVRLELQLPAEPGAALEIQADGPALQQALVNLLDNALKHAPAESAVTVRLECVAGLRSADGHVRPKVSPTGSEADPGGLADEAVRAPLGVIRLSVRDTGPGIPAEDYERIFERFYRRGSELRRETQGIGLGLAIVKHVVEGHGGRVWVESEPGQGATFVVELSLGEGNQCSVVSRRAGMTNEQCPMTNPTEH